MVLVNVDLYVGDPQNKKISYEVCASTLHKLDVKPRRLKKLGNLFLLEFSKLLEYLSNDFKLTLLALE